MAYLCQHGNSEIFLKNCFCFNLSMSYRVAFCCCSDFFSIVCLAFLNTSYLCSKNFVSLGPTCTGTRRWNSMIWFQAAVSDWVLKCQLNLQSLYAYRLPGDCFMFGDWDVWRRHSCSFSSCSVRILFFLLPLFLF